MIILRFSEGFRKLRSRRTRTDVLLVYRASDITVRGQVVLERKPSSTILTLKVLVGLICPVTSDLMLHLDSHNRSESIDRRVLIADPLLEMKCEAHLSYSSAEQVSSHNYALEVFPSEG